MAARLLCKVSGVATSLVRILGVSLCVVAITEAMFRPVISGVPGPAFFLG